MTNQIRKWLRKPVQEPKKFVVDQEAVLWSYRLFLDRYPENEDVILEKIRSCHNSQELRLAFMFSEEFRQRNPGHASTALSGEEPGLAIEAVESEAELQVLFEHIQAVWQKLGETEPYWSVCTADKFLQTNLQNNNVDDEFYASGQTDLVRILKTLERNGLASASRKACLEYGCGLGRVTHWLAECFEVVYGYDISQAHLQGAEAYINRKKISNVVLKQVKTISDIADLPRVDLIYSVIVLQHNPPPMIAYMIRQFMRALNPGGLALFQVPTYRLGYEFALQRYLLEEAQQHTMEMHVLPQSQIFEIVRQEGGTLIEVLEDGWTGLRHKEVSNTFLVQKT